MLRNATIGIPIRATYTRFEKGVSLTYKVRGMGGICIFDYFSISACDYEKNKKAIGVINALTCQVDISIDSFEITILTPQHFP